MTNDVNSWMDQYERAWTSNEPDDIRALFTEDAVYNDRPNTAKPWNGHEEIVKAWADAGDKPEDWTFEWTLLGREDDTAFVQGLTTYLNGDPTYDNLWVIRFAEDGRAREFTEWYMARK
ncbi:nuclear transport factor 2 family protein [Arthrobacter sp. 18067]|uniref:nuclear transport factor 2 family protein n=1 Tax=Arthrobacter sp. 18067 TaxID=2681413 RepID=UPI00135B7771|nr:nuclear transport factor 2 family protein [Arthrobacter sp. 18067]